MFLHTSGVAMRIIENMMLLRGFSKCTEVSGKIKKVTRLFFNSMLTNWYTYLHFFRVHSAGYILEAVGGKYLPGLPNTFLGSKNVSSSQICSTETLLCFKLSVKEMFTSSPVVGFVNGGHIKKTSLRKSGRPVNYREDKDIQLLTKGTPL